MKITRTPVTILSACGLAGALAAGTLALGCDAGPSNTPAQSTTAQAGGAPALTYDALLEVLGNPDPFERARQLGELLPKLGRDSLRPVKLILKMTSQAEIELGASDYELLMAYWARF